MLKMLYKYFLLNSKYYTTENKVKKLSLSGNLKLFVIKFQVNESTLFLLINTLISTFKI